MTKKISRLIITLFALMLIFLAACEPPDDGDDDGGGITTTTTSIYDSSAIEMTWITIPGGTFEMGCLSNNNCDDNSLPVHTVEVTSFEMTEVEVTLYQYMAITGDNASWFGDCNECPVERVTWQKAEEFCEDIGGRLPTEAEWEYAARAGSNTIFTCGNTSGCLDDHAWYAENSDDQTHPAGEKDPNAFGLYDMTGNVSEWVQDCWNDNYQGAPTDGSAWDAGTCSQRITRGGSWNDQTSTLAVSHRNRYNVSGMDNLIGFRCAREID